MRWRLGRPAAKNTATARPLDLIVASASLADTAAAAAAASTSRERGGSQEIEPPALGDDEDSGELYCATAATCLRLRGRMANSKPACCARPCTLDGLSASLMSYVTRVGSQPTPAPSPAENCDNSKGSQASTRHDDDDRTKAGSRGEGPKKSYLSALGVRSHGRSQTAAFSPSSPRIIERATTQEEDLLISEIHDFQLRCGAGQKVASGAARVSLALILPREPTPEEMKDLGPLELVSLARANLGLSSAASSCLLAHLVRQDSNAAQLATAGTDFDFSRLCSPTADDPDCTLTGVVEDDVNTTIECYVGAKSNGIVRSGTENVVMSAAEKEEAVAGAKALTLACRTWRDTISAISDMARGGIGYHTGADLVGATQGKAMCGSGEETTLSQSDTSWSCSLESREGQCRPTGKENNERSIKAKVATSERVDGSQQSRVSHKLQQAIRAVTSGANGCYGQLVVLGYKEFTVRDSTWHRVGLKNEKFVLRRRETSNGVHVGGSRGGSIESNSEHNNDNERRVVHKKNTVCSPSCCQPDSKTTATPVTPTNHAEANDERLSGTGGVAYHGPQAEFKTPEARSNGPGESFGGMGLPQRARGGSENANATRNGTNDGGERGGHGSENLDARRRGCFPIMPSDGQRDAGERKTPYRIQLLLSAQQREAAKRMGFGQAQKAPTVEAAPGSDEDTVTISCSADDGCDMYQLGRMEGGGNDFAVRGPLHQSKPGGKVCGPVSRYAVRLLVDRAPPYRCRIFTGGFNSRKCLMLPKSSPKWLEKNGEWDALTPFGVRILKPEVGAWREVTMAGAVRQPRVGHLDIIGDLVPDENNELTCGTIIDVGGVQMMYDSAEKMSRLGGVSPSRVVDLLNSRRPQCPVQLQTLRFKPWQPPPLSAAPETTGGAGSVAPSAGSRALGLGPGVAAAAAAASVVDVDDDGEKTDVERDDDGDIEAKSRVPHVFPACGHVQGYAKQLASGPCPMCRTPGPLVEILFGWCPAIDRDVPTVVFNPCGHAASLEVAERWSRLEMPNNAPPDAVYRPICPYCAKPLLCKNGERPYSKMVFAR